MKFLVDAKLLNGQPMLRILDADTGAVRLEWSLVRTQQMLRDGEIKPEEFLRPELYGMNLLVKNLFLLACLEDSRSMARDQQQISDDEVSLNGPSWQFSLKVRAS